MARVLDQLPECMCSFDIWIWVHRSRFISRHKLLENSANGGRDWVGPEIEIPLMQASIY